MHVAARMLQIFEKLGAAEDGEFTEKTTKRWLFSINGAATVQHSAIISVIFENNIDILLQKPFATRRIWARTVQEN